MIKPTKGATASSVIVLGLGSILGWGVATLLSRPAPLPDAVAFSLIDVTQGEVSRSVQLNAAATWSEGSDVVNAAEGVLTERLVANGRQVDPGGLLYSVNLSPVAVAEGAVPAFRDLVVGVRGADVSQLQKMLRSTGHRAGAPTGYFDSTTQSEVRAWQGDAGLPPTGRARFGSLVFVPQLPAPVGWAATGQPNPDGTTLTHDQGAVGKRLAVGDVVARLLPPTPAFSIDLPAAQLRLVQTGMSVTLNLGKHQWAAEVGAIAPPDQDGSATATLRPPQQADSICGRECGAVPVVGDGSVAATIMVVAPVSGPLVPTAALVVAADGTSALVTEENQTIPITVLATSGGQAVISGVDPGTRIRVPGAGIPETAEGDG